MSHTEHTNGQDHHLEPHETGSLTREGWRVEFNGLSPEPQITYNGVRLSLVHPDKLCAPPPSANNVAAPALMRHQFGARYGLNRTDIGQMIEVGNICHGILLAPDFRHVSRQGREIGPRFDIFTTVHDTRHITRHRAEELGTYNEDIQRIADLKTYGHSGILLRDDTEIYHAAIHRPELLVGWHMPVRALVDGVDVGRHQKQHNPDNMYNHSEIGLLAGTFTKVRGSALDHWYQTASVPRNEPSVVYIVDFTGRNVVWGPKDTNDLSSHPVRAVIRGAELKPGA